MSQSVRVITFNAVSSRLLKQLFDHVVWSNLHVILVTELLNEDERRAGVEFVVNLTSDRDAVSFADHWRRHFHPQRVVTADQRTCRNIRPMTHVPSWNHISAARFSFLISVFTAQCTLVHMRGFGIACRPLVRPSVTLVDCNHIGWKSWKLITRTVSPTPSLFVAKRRST